MGLQIPLDEDLSTFNMEREENDIRMGKSSGTELIENKSKEDPTSRKTGSIVQTKFTLHVNLKLEGSGKLEKAQVQLSTWVPAWC